MSASRWLGRAERLGPDRWRILSVEYAESAPDVWQPTGQKLLIQEIQTQHDVYIPRPVGRGFEVTTEIVILVAQAEAGEAYPIDAGAQHYWARGRELSKAEWERTWLAAAR